jgi:thiamine biosynthesis lipoprotein
MSYKTFLCSLALVTAVTAGETLLTRTQMHMGTLVSISLPQKEIAHSEKAYALIHEIEMALSSYAAAAEVYRLNHGEELTASPYLQEAIDLSRRFYRESEGYFDITVGSITKKGFRFGEDERVPGEEELDASTVDIDGIIAHGSKMSLEPGVVIDLGGMGKGYAVDKAAEYLMAENVQEAIIAASGDIRCLDICRIDIQNPFKEGVAGSFTTRHKGMAISTSGNYRRYVTSTKHNHLIDPIKKRSQQHFASITLVAALPNSDLDAYATAASVMPMEKAVGFLTQRGVDYIMITTAKEVVMSETIKRSVNDVQIDLK